MPPSRRRALELFGTALAGGLAGCGSRDTTPTTTDGPPSTGDRTASPTETPTPEPFAAEAWSVDLDGLVRRLRLPGGSPLSDAAPGPVLAATDAGVVAAVSFDDGTVLWRGSAAGTPGDRAPTVRLAGEHVLVTSRTLSSDRLRGFVSSFDPATGERRWTDARREFRQPLGVVEGSVYVAGAYIRAPPSELGPEEQPAGEERLHALDAATGEERWSVTVPRLRVAAVDTTGVYVLTDSVSDGPAQQLRAFGPDGSERWSVDTAARYTGGLVADGRGPVAAAGHAVARYDPATGERRWTVGGWSDGYPEVTRLADGTLVAGSDPVVGVGPDGTERFRADDAVGLTVQPATAETVYLAGGQGVVAVDRAAGTVRWRYDPGEDTYAYAEAVVDAGLVVSEGIGPTNALALHDAADGDVVGRFRTPPQRRSTVAAGRRLLAGTGDLTALNLRV